MNWAFYANCRKPPLRKTGEAVAPGLLGSHAGRSFLFSLQPRPAREMPVSTPAIAASPEVRPSGPAAGTDPGPDLNVPLWARFFLPSVADVLFIALLLGAYAFAGRTLLADSDIGWHIRNGEHILATRSVPHADYFSYTMAGRPWYAWEWLYDAIIAGVHSYAGLNGVVLFGAFIFALTFALLFRFTLKSSGSLPAAMGLTFLSLTAASIHLLGRPHLVTWLFTLLWFEQLNSFQRGQRKRLLALPFLMLLWANLHGGFLLGVALLALFLGANLWTRFTASCRQSRMRACQHLEHLSVVLVLSLAATLVTPYGYRLHLHLGSYLGNRYLMDHISEFQTPSFHLLRVQAFVLLLIVALVALALNRSRARALDLFTIAFSTWAGVYAARNVPIASILLSLVIAPILGVALRDLKDQQDIAFWIRRMTTAIDDFSIRIGAIELRLKAHVLPAIVAGFLAINPSARGVFSQKGMSIHFDEKRAPVHAAEFMAEHNIRSHFYNPDAWGGYLIYRLYPNVQVMVDDRHDFYGAAFVKDHLTILNVGHGWRELLDKNQVSWVVVPVDSPLANTLAVVDGWEVVHQDDTAVIFARAKPWPAK